MSIFAYIIIGLGIALAIVFKLFEEQIKAFFKENAKSADIEEFPFYAKKVMTDPEQVLYHRLVEALPDYIVLAQVQLSRFLNVKKGFNSSEWSIE